MKITFHRALAEIKSTANRIEKLTFSTVVYVDVYNKATKLSDSGRRKEDVEREIMGNYDKFAALFKNLKTLKFALARANAGITENTELSTIDFADEKLTITEILALKDIMNYQRNLLDVLKNQYARATSLIQKNTKTLEARLDSQITNSLNLDKIDNNEAIIKTVTDAFWENNGYELIDPLNIAEMISNMDKEITSIMLDIDTTLSQENALRTIDVDLAG